MSTEENKKIAMRSVEMFNKDNRAMVDHLIDEIYAPNCVIHDPGLPDLEPGSDGIKKFIHEVLEDMPDFHQTIEDMIAEGDKVVCRISMGGTEVTTGIAVNWQAMSISRMTDGKIVEEWDLEVRVPVSTEKSH